MGLLNSRTYGSPPPARQTGRLLKNRQVDSPRAHELVTGVRLELAETIEQCVAAGVGLLVSPTSDGGAVSITVYAGDKRERDYAGNPDEMAALLSAVRDFAEAATYQGPKK
jgi:hypothetical protein